MRRFEARPGLPGKFREEGQVVHRRMPAPHRYSAEQAQRAPTRSAVLMSTLAPARRQLPGDEAARLTELTT